MPEWPFSLDAPYESYGRVRSARGGVFRGDDDVVYVLDFAVAAALLRDGATWSSDPSLAPGLIEALGGVNPFAGSMLFSDGASHVRLRSAANRFFTPRAMASLEDRIAAILDVALAPLVDGEPVELMGEVAYPLSVAVIAELFDIGVEGASVLRDAMPVLASFLELDPSPALLSQTAEAALDVMLSLVPLVAERRVSPGDDLLSALIDSSLTTDEVIGTCLLLLGAGHETTATTIGNAAVALWEAGVAHVDDARVAVDELLRYEPPAQITRRVARVDGVLGDVAVRAGDQVVVALAACNRDPARFTEPDVLQLDRNDGAGLAFGVGPHFCLGAGLARLELRLLLERLPALVGQWDAIDVVRDPSRTFRRIRSLRVGARVAA